jgi:hypothetical protein
MTASPFDPEQIAELVRARLVAAAEAAYEDAGIQGLCLEGRLEAAMSAMKKLDLAELLRDLPTPDR